MNSWFIDKLRSPLNGCALELVAPHLLSDGENLWPFVDEIPYLRIGRKELISEAVNYINRGEIKEAIAILLTDRKDETIPTISAEDALTAMGADNIQLAMQGLHYGGMAPYIFHRWSLPTFLSGLKLMDLFLDSSKLLLEVGCGAAHFIATWQRRGGRAIGADLVFSNLWLAKRYVSNEGCFVCCDANYNLPLADGSVEAVLCHDAFHYIKEKLRAVREFERVSATGPILLGHIHNKDTFNFSPGYPIDVSECADMLRPSYLFDDAELTASVLSKSNPQHAAHPRALGASNAVAFVVNAPGGMSSDCRFSLPGSDVKLLLNPLIVGNAPIWPSLKFQQEFVEDWSYLRNMRNPDPGILDVFSDRGLTTQIVSERLVRERVFLDLPEGWTAR